MHHYELKFKEMKKHLINCFVLSKPYYMIVLIALVLVSCKKDDETSQVTLNIEGFWIAQETTTGDCSGSQATETKTSIYSVEKGTGNAITVTLYPRETELAGTLIGNEIEWGGTIPTSSGSMLLDFNGTVNNTGQTATGSGTWTWSSNSSSYECSGTVSVTGSKVIVETVDFTGNWQGTWESEEYNLDGTFSVQVTQSGSTLSGTIDVPEIGLDNAALKGQVNGNVVFFGDVGDIIKFVGLLNGTTATGAYVYPSYSDDGEWTATKQ